uniref:SET domain-containing protein n=1 Tax=Brassica oleracea var. oleracea TaxID=109376 RepID=A0A0D3C9Y8_BRAOL
MNPGRYKSRAFSRLRGQNLVLIPLADLINHNPAITTEDSAYKIKGGGLFSRDLFFSLEIPRFCSSRYTFSQGRPKRGRSGATAPDSSPCPLIY